MYSRHRHKQVQIYGLEVPGYLQNITSPRKRKGISWHNGVQKQTGILNIILRIWGLPEKDNMLNFILQCLKFFALLGACHESGAKTGARIFNYHMGQETSGHPWSVPDFTHTSICLSLARQVLTWGLSGGSGQERHRKNSYSCAGPTIDQFRVRFYPYTWND
jgi:hypothetical protein